MKTKILSRLVLLLALSGGSCAWANSKLINLQGKITNTSGNPLSGAVTVTFRLYTSSTASVGSAVWVETQGLTASNGLFNATLGQVTALDSLAFTTPYYLGMQVAGDSNELTPRQLLGASAYSQGSLGDFNAAGNLVVGSSVTAGNVTTASLVLTNQHGTVIQSTSSMHTGDVATSATIWYDTGLSASIKPMYATSKVRILIFHHCATNAAFVTNEVSMDLRLVRDNNTVVRLDAHICGARLNNSGMGSGTGLGQSFMDVVDDAPGDTNTHTYKTQFEHNNGAGGTVYIYEATGGPGQMVLEEISG